jgi:uncharacterized damage-inducible protein DinB
MDLLALIVPAWRTNHRATVRFVEQLPPALWGAEIPGVPRRTIRQVAAHLHNARCRWIRTLGREHGVRAPARVDQHAVTPRQLVAALGPSGEGIESLLRLGVARGGVLPPSKGYTWRNLPLDVGHVLTYFSAHEAHHRGQIIMAARQLGQRLPPGVVNGVWQWTRLSKR